MEMMNAQWDQGRFLCVGLDTDVEKLPESARMEGIRESVMTFNREIIDATKDIAGSYKPNIAFYEAYGDLGWIALQETVAYIHEVAPETPVILDAKRADIGNTNQGYLTGLVDRVGANAITVHPYLGSEALAPFLERSDIGVFVLCRTSNAGAGEFQDLEVSGQPLYQHVAKAVRDQWNGNGNCGIVVGATYPEEMKKIRTVADDLPFLIPGIGAQGGDLEKTVAHGKDSRGRGMIIAISRAIIYASANADYAGAARARALEYDAAIRAAL